MTQKLVEQAIRDIQAGKMVVILDDKDRENEGDLVVAAEKVTPESINFMAKYGRGLICMPMLSEAFDRLQISMMVQDNQCQHETGFGVSIGAAKGITTGISAADRAHTICVAANPTSIAKDIVKPGHVFPLKAKPNGLLERQGHTEASTDLMRIAGLQPAAAICEIIKSDGSMARFDDLVAFADRHNLTLLRIEDIKNYRLTTEKLVECVASARVPVEHQAHATMHVYRDVLLQQEWVAMVFGDITKLAQPLVRLHSACLTGDIFGSTRCDCGAQLKIAISEMSKQGGVLLYLPQEGRGIGLVNKIKAYALQDQGLDTVEANEQLGFHADQRDYLMAAKVLQALGINQIRLLTNNPQKLLALSHWGIQVAARVPLVVTPTAENSHYLQTKAEKLGHLLSITYEDNLCQIE